MGSQDFQVMVKNESVHNTPVTPDRTFEYDSESIEEDYGRTRGDALRVGSAFRRSDRFTPYFKGAAGPLVLPMMTKGMGFWLPHMMGQVATTGPAETVVYTHTGSEATLTGDSFTCQVNRPFHPSGTNQPFTYAGGKVTGWTISNSVDENLMLALDTDFASVATATALATAGYPASMDNLTWAGGLVTIGGSAYDVTNISVAVDNAPNIDRRFLRQNTDKKEQISNARSGTFSLSADFESLTQRNRAAATTRAGALTTLVATWKGPTLLGSTIYPEFTVSIAAAEFDKWKGATEGPEGITQELSGEIDYDGSTSPLILTYKSADITA